LVPLVCCTSSTNTRYQIEKEFCKAGRLSNVEDEDISGFDLLCEQANKYLKYDPQGNLEVINPNTNIYDFAA
jgi:hypothetical protein